MITRFAPSPTGPLHLGHVYSARLAHDMARRENGRFLLRIEDIDQARSKPKWQDQIYDDLAWLGLNWNGKVRKQSEHIAEYSAALKKLAGIGLLYECNCNRRDIAEAASAPQEGAMPPTGPDGIKYPGTCRPKNASDGSGFSDTCALRLNFHQLDESQTYRFTETGTGPRGETGEITFTTRDAMALIGDPVVRRRDFGTSYHLSVVVDDAAQDISHVIRGEDLFEATLIHVILQQLLGLPTPIYHHHRLIRDATGRRLAKRDDARSIDTYRKDGLSPKDIFAILD